MTKTLTKIVAGLGVVSGLSVAILPLTTHAADVITSVTIDATTNAGTCTVGTSTTAVPAKCTGGGNNATGYTITIADKDTVKFNLSSSDANGGTSGGLAPIASASPTISGTNVYGLKFSAAASSGSGYAGVYSGSLVSGSHMSSAGAAVNYVPVAAAIGTVQTASPGNVDITTSLGESHNLAIPDGTYQNTITIVYAAK